MKKGKGNILVLDDEPVILETVKEILEHFGYDVFTALSIEEAESFMKVFNPDVILSDMNFPRGSGIQFFDHVKRELANIDKHPSFIFMSAAAQKDDVELGLSIGADAYLTKPFDFKLLISTIEKSLKKDS